MARKAKQSGSGKARLEKQAGGNDPEGEGFEQLLLSLAPGSSKKPPANTTWQGATLAHLEYMQELELKNRALQTFWQRHRLPGVPETVRASPLPRHYRTTSTRRAAWRRGALFLHLAGQNPSKLKQPFLASPLEPESHARIYRFLRAKISEAAFGIVAKHLNYLVIRGSYAEQAVIFNVNTMNSPLVRKLKLLAGHLQDMEEPIVAAFVYPDPSSSAYYLEASRPADMPRIKQLFGRQRLMVEHHGRRFLFHPTSFSQVNQSIVPLMLEESRALLQPRQEERLLDLYCGYGLFSHYLASEYGQVMGLDAEGPSIDAATANKRLHPAGKRTRFRAVRITSGNLERWLPAPWQGKESILLDPPRQGPEEGVIPALARRGPGKVLHIHCNADLLPQSIRQWGKQGYKPYGIIALDMFPGTPALEILLACSKVDQD
ncbi:MAG: hypothetical protein ACLFOA_03865 [Desulfohalobiaceae bacterium]